MRTATSPETATAADLHGPLKSEDFRFTPPTIDKAIAGRFLEARWNVAGELKRLAGERDQNFRVTDACGRHSVMKISSPNEDRVFVDFQVQALRHLEAADPGIPVPRIIPSAGGGQCEDLESGGDVYVVRLLSWVQGAPIGCFDPPEPGTITRIGELQGRICRAFAGFSHEAASKFMPWDILNGLVTTEQLRRDYLKDGLASECADALGRLQRDAIPRMRQLPHQVIHNDAHAGNVMCDPDDPSRITGVIDFGDLVARPLVVDLATSLSSIVEHSATPLEAAYALVRGFTRHQPLPGEQAELLYDATLARAILTVELLQFRADHTDTDEEIQSVELPDAIAGVRRMLTIDAAEFLDAIRAATPSVARGRKHD